ncbi:hypothetical protein HDU91_006353 [Kappamyces sp. JEL0680]|nr:hypothetical protein HDU91_006353 [Kappamyces sp. JEL0680]
MKVENLARGLEQHIYETAESRANYMEKIRDQLANIERKGDSARWLTVVANEVRNSQNQLGADDGQNGSAIPALNDDVGQHALLGGHSQPTPKHGDTASIQQNNSLGLDVAVHSGGQHQLAESGLSVGGTSTQAQSTAPTPPTQHSSPATKTENAKTLSNAADAGHHASNEGHGLLDFSNVETAGATETPNDGTFGESQVNGSRRDRSF